MAYDIHAGDWSEAILHGVGVDENVFARVVASGAPAGELGRERANELGLPPGTIVTTGGFDQCCAALGAGVIDSSVASIGTGSVEALHVFTAGPHLTEDFRRANLCVSPHVTSLGYLTIGTSFAAGSLLRWYAEALDGHSQTGGDPPGEDAFDAIMRSVPAQPSHLLVLPHLSGAFSPVRDPASKGAILGLQTTTAKPELLRGLLEGTAFELRRIIDSVETGGVAVDNLRNTGGGAKSFPWPQIKADVLGRTVATTRVKDSSSLGAAILAAVSIEEFPDCRAAVDSMVHVDRVYEPDPSLSRRYDDRYELYRNLQATTGQFHHAL